MNPIIPIAIGGVSIAALMLALKGKTPPSLEGPTYMKGAAGSRQFEVKHVGPGYVWEVRGDKEGSGSDNVSGTALTTMFEFLFSGNNAEIVTAQVAKGSEPGMAGSFTVHKEQGAQWGWLVSKPSPDQATALGTGDSTSRGGATLAALSAIAPYTDWIVGVPSPVGGALDPTVQGTLIDVQQRDGLIFTSSSVAAFDLPTWLAHAAPLIVPKLNTSVELALAVKQIHTELLGLEAPEGYKYTGKTYAQVLASMQETLEAWRTEKYLAIAPVEYTLAAQAIGAKISTVGKTGRVKGRPIVVRYYNARYEWLVWTGGNRGSDAEAFATGEAFMLQRAWVEAVAAASKGPDLQGGGLLGPGQQGQPGVAPCVSLKTTQFSRNLPSATVQESVTRDIKLWTPPTALCNRFTLHVGVCLLPVGGGTFGDLDFYTEGQTQDGPLVKAQNDDVQIYLERADGSQVDWFLFRKPLAWKRQFEIEIAYEGGQVEILSTKRVDEPSVDACPDRQRRWPGLGDDHYKVGLWGNGAPGKEDPIVVKNWVSQPSFGIRVEGKQLITEIQYYGLPQFRAGTFVTQKRILAALESKKTSYTIAFKVRSEGRQV